MRASYHRTRCIFSHSRGTTATPSKSSNFPCSAPSSLSKPLTNAGERTHTRTHTHTQTARARALSVFGKGGRERYLACARESANRIITRAFFGNKYRLYESVCVRVAFNSRRWRGGGRRFMMHEGSRCRRCRWTVYYPRRACPAGKNDRCIAWTATDAAGFADFVARGG